MMVDVRTGAAILALLVSGGPALAQSASAPLPGPYAPPTLDPRDLSGVWWTRSNDPNFRPVAGPIPFTAAGRMTHDATAAGLKSGRIDDPSISRCLAPGPSRVMAAPYPLQIVQTADEVAIVPEAWHAYREVFINANHTDPDALDPTFLGESVGHWEGATLVVDTTGLKGSVWLDASGIPHSDALHIVERIRKLPGGTQLEDVITFEDPKIFTHSWSARRVYEYRPDIRLTDYVCGDANRNIAWAERLPQLPPAIAARRPKPATPPGAGDFSGVWNHKRRQKGAGSEFRYAFAVTADGAPAPLQPWAQAQLDRHKQAIADHHPISGAAERCLGFGMPDFLNQPYPYKFMLTADVVLMLAEADHQYRIISMNQPHPTVTETSWSGNSIGHWEGDTLVVETVGQNDRSPFSGSGIPKTEALKLTEHFRLTDNGQILENRIAIDDPGTFTHPWEAKWLLDRMPPGSRLLEYMCAENERDAAQAGHGGPDAAARSGSSTPNR